MLRQRWRAEARRHRAAQRDLVGERIARGKFARGLAAEIAVVLVTPGQAGRERVGEVGFQIRIQRVAVARVLARHARSEAAEPLRATGQRAGLEIRARFARRLVPLFVAVLGAEGHRHRIGQAPVETALDVQVDDVLRGFQRAVVERGGRGRAQADVERIAGMEIDAVVAVVVAGVPVPTAGGGAAHAGHQRAILGVGLDLRQEALRIDRQDVLRGAARRAKKRERGDVAVTGGGKRIAGDAVGEGEFGIGRDRLRIDLRVANLERLPADCRLRDAGRAGIGARAVGGILLVELGGDVQPAAVAAVGHAGVAGELVVVAVARRILAEAGLQAAALFCALEHDVDHTGNGVGAVLRRGAVAQHFHPCDGRDRDGVQIHRRRAATDGAVEVEQRGGVAALAIDQHQHLIGRQAAQLRGTDRAGAIAQRRAREVQRGQGARQRGGQFRGAGGLQRFGADDVDRRLRLGHGAVRHAGAGDDDRIQGVGRGSRRRGGLGQGGGGKQCSDHGGRKRGNGGVHDNSKKRGSRQDQARLGRRRSREGEEDGGHAEGANYSLTLEWRRRNAAHLLIPFRSIGLSINDFPA